VIQGENGVSQKAEGVGKASYYVSFPRLAVKGEITVGDAVHAVTGTAWMDHEWFTNQLDESQQGWDWFSVQLDDQTELMLFELRRKDGTIDPYSSGTYVDREGRGHHLTSKDFSLRPLQYWKRYPVKWQIEAPALHLSLTCEAALRDQELRSAANTYWEGAVTYSGSQRGVGYLEMTGYDRPVRW
jgi:predicted secreted hydrolase